ncbi:hypothetical protein IIU_07023 [Bacillus cereus VD133]|uniref:Uncharacterized protein n=1 Tax=Bacillus cereus VD133 TaxID=1053233 RepID=A0A9W5PJ93_BACCE|nr:hypothetical protein IIU_07023 [Bacillus cereus VD133]
MKNHVIVNGQILQTNKEVVTSQTESEEFDRWMVKSRISAIYRSASSKTKAV